MPDRSQFIMLFFAFSFGMILSNLLGQSQAKKPEQADEVLFVYRGVDQTLEDLPRQLAEELTLLDVESDAKRRALLSVAALQMHLYDYASTQQLDLNQAGEQLFQLNIPDEQAINEFYHQHSGSIDKPFYQVRSDIKKHLTQRYAKQAKQQKLNELIERGDLAILPDSRTRLSAAVDKMPDR